MRRTGKRSRPSALDRWNNYAWLALEPLEHRLTLSATALASPYVPPPVDWTQTALISQQADYSNSQAYAGARHDDMGPFDGSIGQAHSTLENASNGAYNFSSGPAQSWSGPSSGGFAAYDHPDPLMPRASDFGVGGAYDHGISTPGDQLNAPAAYPAANSLTGITTSGGVNIIVASIGRSIIVVEFDTYSPLGLPSSTPALRPAGRGPDPMSENYNEVPEQRVVESTGEGAGRVAQIADALAGSAAKERLAPQMSLGILPLSNLPAASVDANAAGRHPLPLAINPQSTFDATPAPITMGPQWEPGIGSRAAGDPPASGDAANSTGPEGKVEKESVHRAETATPAQGAGALESATFFSSAIDAPRAALLDSLPLNMRAVDQALASLVDEVEQLRGAWAEWLAESNVPPWTAVATIAAGCAIGRYVWRMRGRRWSPEESEEESSSWLFTQFQTPVGQR